MWRSLNNSVHFNLLCFELLSREHETEHDVANAGRRNLGPISVCLVNKQSACKLTHHIAAAAGAPAAAATAVR